MIDASYASLLTDKKVRKVGQGGRPEEKRPRHLRQLHHAGAALTHARECLRSPYSSHDTPFTAGTPADLFASSHLDSTPLTGGAVPECAWDALTHCEQIGSGR